MACLYFKWSSEAFSDWDMCGLSVVKHFVQQILLCHSSFTAHHRPCCFICIIISVNPWLIQSDNIRCNSTLTFSSLLLFFYIHSHQHCRSMALSLNPKLTYFRESHCTWMFKRQSPERIMLGLLPIAFFGSSDIISRPFKSHRNWCYPPLVKYGPLLNTTPISSKPKPLSAADTLFDGEINVICHQFRNWGVSGCR